MNKTAFVFKHELGRTVKRKGFVILTVAFPLVGMLILGIAMIVQATSVAPTEEINVGYVDQAGDFGSSVYNANGIALIYYEDSDTATEALLAQDIDEYFVIPENYIESGSITRYTTKKELEPPESTYMVMRDFLLDRLLSDVTTAEILERSKSPIYLSSIKLDETGNVDIDQGGLSGLIVPFLFGILLIASTFSSSGYLLQGLAEEKENRIMEILLSSISTRQLLAGKVLGLGAAGLFQISIWLVLSTFLLRLASTTIGVFSTVSVSGALLVLCLAYFILGYLLFAILMAGVGAITTSVRDSQQMSGLFIVPAILPIYIFMFFLRDNPDHIIGSILTLIPITAPTAVFMRLIFTTIPVWELVLSIILLLVTIIGGLILVAKIFRTTLLMYGKRPGIREIIRHIRKA